MNAAITVIIFGRTRLTAPPLIPRGVQSGGAPGMETPRVKAFVTTAPSASVTWAVTAKFPPAFGVPVNSPALFMLSPGSSVPGSEKVYGGAPPLASSLN